jgi:hypothetical protein
MRMSYGYNAEQRIIAAESQRLANADLSGPHGQPTGDHAAHAPGKTCMICGHAIEAGQDARRRGEAKWMHEVCPLAAE